MLKSDSYKPWMDMQHPKQQGRRDDSFTRKSFPTLEKELVQLTRSPKISHFDDPAAVALEAERQKKAREAAAELLRLQVHIFRIGLR